MRNAPALRVSSASLSAARELLLFKYSICSAANGCTRAA
jgi:hypothetical protein